MAVARVNCPVIVDNAADAHDNDEEAVHNENSARHLRSYTFPNRDKVIENLNSCRKSSIALRTFNIQRSKTVAERCFTSLHIVSQRPAAMPASLASFLLATLNFWGLFEQPRYDVIVVG
jgi:hypothetical protein